MRYRKLDANGDRVFGGSQAAFWVNVPDAPGQAVQTRLGLWLGQWFLKPSDGTPYLTKVLGKYTGATRDIALRTRTLQTPGINAIVSYSSSLNPTTRVWPVNATLNTVYGAYQFSGTVNIPQGSQ